jgi:hypothetical protein
MVPPLASILAVNAITLNNVGRSEAVFTLASGHVANVVACGWGCGRGSSTAAGSVFRPLSEVVACLHSDL